MTNEDKIQDNQIQSIKNILDKKVPWTIFAFVLSIFIVAFGWVLSSVSASNTVITQNTTRISSVEGDIKAMNAKLDIILNYFQLTPRQQEQLKTLNLNK